MRAYKKTKEGDSKEEGFPVKKPKPVKPPKRKKSKRPKPLLDDKGLIQSGITEGQGLF